MADTPRDPGVILDKLDEKLAAVVPNLTGGMKSAVRSLLREFGAVTREQADAIDARVAECSVCRELEDFYYFCFSGSDDRTLPPGVARILESGSALGSQSRGDEVVPCPSCGTPYRHTRDYEFLMVAEDEITFTRLTPSTRVDAFLRMLDGGSEPSIHDAREYAAVLRMAWENAL